MIEDEYDTFFDEVKKFKEEQNKQKQRGLNDYNMVNVVRKENAEVGMHSNVIYSLINPNGLHYQGDLFLKLFIKYVIEPELDLNNEENYKNFGEVFAVESEELTEYNRRIDFTIKSNNYYIGIEMKIDADDLDKQLFDYKKDLLNKVKKDKSCAKVIIYYLTKDGKNAPKSSLCDDKEENCISIKRVSFEDHILNWIDACQEEVRNITNLNQAFENYKTIVKKITNPYEGKIMALEDELLKDEEKYKIARDISDAYIKAKKTKDNKIRKEFIDCIQKEISDLNYNIEREEVETSQWFCLKIKEGCVISIFKADNGVYIQVAFPDENLESYSENIQQVNKNFKYLSNKFFELRIFNKDVEAFDFKNIIIQVIKIAKERNNDPL